MYSSNNEVIGKDLIVLTIVAMILIVHFGDKARNKVSNKLRNRYIDKYEQKNMPEQENLADRYNNVNHNDRENRW